MTQAERAARPESFPHAAREALASRQMRANVPHATTTIRAKRALAVAEVPDWEELRAAGAAIKDHALLSLERLLVELEGAVASRGGTVHWARDAAEANAVVTTIVHGEGENEIVKVKSLTTDETGLNDALERAEIHALETDLAELIVQLARERPSHLLVPQSTRTGRRSGTSSGRSSGSRTQRRPGRADWGRPRVPARRFPRARGRLGGQLRLCGHWKRRRGRVGGQRPGCARPVPEVLVTVMGIEKVVPTFRDLEVMLRTAVPFLDGRARMNPYTSMWSGVHAGDGPRAFHLVLLDNGRTEGSGRRGGA